MNFRFVAELRRVFEQSGMTKIGLSQELGLSRAAVAWWFSGKNKPSPANVARMEQLFNVPPGTLLIPLGYGEFE